MNAGHPSGTSDIDTMLAEDRCQTKVLFGFSHDERYLRDIEFFFKIVTRNCVYDFSGSLTFNATKGKIVLLVDIYQMVGLFARHDLGHIAISGLQSFLGMGIKELLQSTFVGRVQTHT